MISALGGRAAAGSVGSWSQSLPLRPICLDQASRRGRGSCQNPTTSIIDVARMLGLLERRPSMRANLAIGKHSTATMTELRANLTAATSPSVLALWLCGKTHHQNEAQL
jgi:hypothetical protein